MHLLALLAALAGLVATAPAHTQKLGDMAPPSHPALQILWDQELLSDPSPAMDVRWASARSVYVLWLHHGVSELAMDGNFTALRDLFPDATGDLKSPYPYLGFSQLAVSQEFLVAAAFFNAMAFRPLQAQGGHLTITKVPVGVVEHLDLSSHLILFLGSPGRAALPGGVAWLGPLTAYPARDLKPVLQDIGGARAPNLINCAGLELGDARFLPDGSFIVVPGFQPGAHLFGRDGQRLRSWDTKALGLDGDAGCAGITEEQLVKFRHSEPARYAYLNGHRVLDAVLPLPQGPGLLIRSVVDGAIHWQLKVLQGGTPLAYDLPLTGSLPYERLRADVRGDRIVLLRTANTYTPYRPGHLYVAQLPRGVVTPATVADGGQP